MINVFKKQNGMSIIGQGVKIISKEEQQLTKAFGKEYEDYMARVDRLVPFKKP